MGTSCTLTTLLVLAVITITRGQTQYIDLLQGLQQLFQPYPGNGNVNVYTGATRDPHRHANGQGIKKKPVENRHRSEDRRTKNHHDHVFATTEKLTHKTTKSSHNNNSRTFNNKNEHSNILFGEYYNPYDSTTNVLRDKTTEASKFNFNSKRGTTHNPFGSNFNVARPAIENVNRRKNSPANNQPRPANLNRNGASLNNNNDYLGAASNIHNRAAQNNDYSIYFPDFNRNNGFNNFGNAGVDFNNRGTTNNNNNIRGNPNQGNDFGGFHYPETPQSHRAGVQPFPVDDGLLPITNRPASNNNNFGVNRPLGSSSVTFNGGQPDREPEILIGPDEDDMTEWQKKRHAEKAEKMCDYYKSLTVKKVVALPLLPSPDPVEFKVSDCVPIEVPLVIGGTVANIADFPHMALVGWKKARNDGYSWKCGGSLISDRYVLTAGHCTYQDKDANVISGPPHAVQLGSSYLDDRGALVVKISAVIRHPKYKQRRSYHDVALIKLVSKVKFSELIRPACLGVPPPTGRSIIATGWGRTEYGGDHSVQLRSVSLDVWDMQECKDIWGTSLKLPNGVTSDSHMCAGDRSGGHDTCQGDSGGPAQIQDGCQWRVVAVTSYGRSCGAPDTPALYAVIPPAFVAAEVFADSS